MKIEPQTKDGLTRKSEPSVHTISSSSIASLAEIKQEDIKPTVPRVKMEAEDFAHNAEAGPSKSPLLAAPTPSTPAEPELSRQQAEVLRRIINGDNFFFTGSAGTGKSVLLRAIIQKFKDRYAEASGDLEDRRAAWRMGKGPDPDMVPGASRIQRGKVGITASTGAAAV